MNKKPLIRTEGDEEDHKVVFEVVRSAFGEDTEAELVDLVRSRNEALISLVAGIDGSIVGHVLLSPIEMVPTFKGRLGGVAPLSVLPSFQNQGIGGLLMKAVISQSLSLGLDALFLLGNPAYYSRFGFATSHIQNEYGATGAFMHMELKKGCLEGATGLAKYVSAFAEVGA